MALDPATEAAIANALDYRDQADTSATEAESSAVTALGYRDDAAGFATDAEAKADTATLAATASTTAADRISLVFVDFQDQYLGALANAPVIGNGGAPLKAGDFYWSTVLNTLRFYTGVIWEAPSVSALNSANTAITSCATATAAAVTAAEDAATANTDANIASTASAAAQVAQSAAQTSEFNAEVWANSSFSYIDSASTLANDTLIQALAAENAQQWAEKWASNPHNSIVANGEYSALHYATEAALALGGLTSLVSDLDDQVTNDITAVNALITVVQGDVLTNYNEFDGYRTTTDSAVGDIISDLANLTAVTVENSTFETFRDSTLSLRTTDLSDTSRELLELSDDMAERALAALTEVHFLNKNMSDAGIHINPATGLAEIYAFNNFIEDTEQTQTNLGIRLDAVDASLTLTATFAYVNDSIAAAVLDSADLLSLNTLESYVYNDLTIALDAAEGDILLKVAQTTYDADIDAPTTGVKARLTTAESDISQNATDIGLRVTQTQYDSEINDPVTGLDVRITDAEVTLSSIDGASITQTVKDIRGLANSVEITDEMTLGNLLQVYKDRELARIDLAFAQESLTAEVSTEREATAQHRLELAAIIDTNLARIITEETTRANEDTALATTISSLTATVGTNTSSIIELNYVAADSDSALARTAAALQVTVDNNTGAILTEASTRATENEVYARSVDALLVQFGAAAADNYDAGYTYLAGQAVMYSGFGYRANATVTGENPNTSAKWDPIADLSLSTWISGDYASDTINLIGLIDGKINTFYANADSPPSAGWDAQTKIDNTGDLWYVSDEKILNRWDGVEWVIIEDQAALNAAAAASGAQATADGKITTYLTPTAPTGSISGGDLWFDTDDENRPYIWDDTLFTPAWVTVRDGTIAIASAAIATVEATKIGYATLDATGSPFDDNGNILDSAGVDTWNIANPGDQATWNVGLPLAEIVKTVQVFDGVDTATVGTLLTARKNYENELEAEASFRIDVNGRVSGFGLRSNEDTASFNISADNFFVTPVPDYTQESEPAGTIAEGAVWYKVSTGIFKTYNSSAWVAFNNISPLVVYTKDTTVSKNGVNIVVPKGAYVPDAFIQEASITNANIAGILQSSLLAGDSQPVWIIDKDGGIDARSIIIRDDDGEIILQSGGFLAADRVSGLGDLSTLNTVAYGDLEASLAGLIDGKAEMWFTTSDPSGTWAGTDASHIDDLWYSSSTRLLKRYDGTIWDTIEDQTAIDAAVAASVAQDTADGKRRVFTANPTSPYDIGDLWDRGSTIGLWRCITARVSGTYLLAEWQVVADTTIDNTAAGFTGQGALATLNEVSYGDLDTALAGTIDGKVEFWFTTSDPSLTPWAGTNVSHTDDLWYSTSTKLLKRYSGTSWSTVENQAAIDAATAASGAQDTADGKRRVFVATPTAPYDVGDLWDRGATLGLWRCITAKTSGQAYALANWQVVADTTINNVGALALINTLNAANVGSYIDPATFDDTYITDLAVEKIVGLDANFVSANINNAAITSAKIAGTIQSDNYTATTGWQILRDTGAATFNNLTIRDTGGNIILSSGAGMAYNVLTGRPTSLSAINGTEGTKLSGIASGADVTSANVAASIAGQTAFATLSQINSGNISTYIASAAIGNVQIGTAAVQTLTIAGGAVSAIETVFGGSTTVPNFTGPGLTVTEQVGSSKAITVPSDATSAARSVLISLGAAIRFVWEIEDGENLSNLDNANGIITLKRNGTVIMTNPINTAINYSGPGLTHQTEGYLLMPWIDTPGAGTHTYTLYWGMERSTSKLVSTVRQVSTQQIILQLGKR